MNKISKKQLVRGEVIEILKKRKPGRRPLPLRGSWEQKRSRAEHWGVIWLIWSLTARWNNVAKVPL